MWETFKKLRDILEPSERRRAVMLLGMILVMGFVESSRVVSVLPFVAVLATPGIVQSNPYLSLVYEWMGFESTNQFVIFLGIALFVVVILALSMSAVMSYASARFVGMRSFTLSRRLFQVYLDRPYEWFLNRNSADLSKSVLGEVNQVVNGSLMPAISLVTDSILALCMIGILVVADPILALLVTGLLGGGYALLFLAVRRHLSEIGEQRLQANRERFRISAEAFGGVKDLKVLGIEPVFLRRFKEPSFRFVNLQVKSALISSLPNYAFQAVTFGVVLAIVGYQMWSAGDLAQALPIITLYAVAGQRLLPSLQSVYRSSSTLRFSKAALNSIHQDLVEVPRREGHLAPAVPLGLHSSIELRDVSYRYPKASANAIDNVNLKIGALSAVGIVGKTGAGKTTLVDILLGLIQPSSGDLIVDGVRIDDSNRRDWLATIGYVPQSIFLSDDTVAANIAFGVAPVDVDMEAVKRAAATANLAEFVESELPEGYMTEIGERGVRLSGGQRQRVGIARALYRNPDVLILDEGTSALDRITETAVMEAIQNLGRRKTVILIAHRLSTVRDCDAILVFDHGKLVASGTFDQLHETDSVFRAMAGAGH